ncbi:beta-defensin 9-like [Arvicanthis niloticus]|uniref:beta-defensin 9-like n=1 Tax=Arvicanthis niloticus TaxID=61156 RepID=UPI00402BC7D4
MRTLCSVLLICCLLFSSTTPAVGLIRRGVKDVDQCLRKRGYCYDRCFKKHRRIGSCRPYRHSCCKNIK